MTNGNETKFQGYIDVGGEMCWWQLKVLVTVLAISITNIHYLLILASGTNIQKMSPTLSHKHQDVTNTTVTIWNSDMERGLING